MGRRIPHQTESVWTTAKQAANILQFYQLLAERVVGARCVYLCLDFAFLRPKRFPNVTLRTPRVPHRARSRAAHERRGRQSLEPQGRNDAPRGLQARPCGPPSLRNCAGIIWSSGRQPCTSGGSNRALRAPTRCSGTSYAPCAGSSASRSQIAPSCSPRSGGPFSPLGSPEWLSGRAGRLN